MVQNQAMAKANGVAIEVLGSIRTVQSNVGERFEAEFFMQRLNRYLRIIKATATRTDIKLALVLVPKGSRLINMHTTYYINRLKRDKLYM